MTYRFVIHEKCHDEMNKLCKKNNLLSKILTRKMYEIVENPHHYKSLKYDLAGERRVHVMKSFVLKFEVDEATKTVRFMAFEHHDEAYRR